MERSEMRGPGPGYWRTPQFGARRTEPARPALPCAAITTRGQHDPATAHRAVLRLSGALPQSQIISGEHREWLGLRVRPAAVRSADRRDRARRLRGTGRA